jgi:serine/threonine protein phosphatase PrpC
LQNRRPPELHSAHHAANDPIEDTFIIQDTENYLYIAIFDGHGGDDVSQYCAVECHGKFEKYLKAMHDPGKALAHSFLETDACWLQMVKQHMGDKSKVRDVWHEVTVGSCAIAAVLDHKKQLLYCGNLGDSRCIVGSVCQDSGILESVEMSRDHSATTDSERLRVRTEHPSDPTVIKEQWDEIVQEYAWFLKNRARFTRSLGDACMKDVDSASFYNDRVPDGLAKMLPLPKKPYVSNKTEVRMRRVAPGDQFIVMACDGLWDEMSSDQVVHTVRHLINLHGRHDNIAERLLQFSLVKIVRRLQAEEPDLELTGVPDLVAIPPGGYGRRGLHDDITIIVVVYDTEANSSLVHRANRPVSALPQVAPRNSTQ